MHYLPPSPVRARPIAGERLVRGGLAAFVLASAGFGCGGASPLLHSAHALRPGQTAFALGSSDRVVLGSERDALDQARQHQPGSPSDDRVTRGLLVALAEGPELSPFAAVRVGLAGTNEVGLSYSGRALRGDARHAFEWDNRALSLGLGVSGQGVGTGALDLPGSDLDRVRGVGFDVPVLFGYRSDADLLSGWVGARASFDHWSGKASLDSSDFFPLRADRWAAGPMFGAAVGLPPFWVAAELEVDYALVTGAVDRSGRRDELRVSGWSARPAGALIARF